MTGPAGIRIFYDDESGVPTEISQYITTNLGAWEVNTPTESVRPFGVAGDVHAKVGIFNLSAIEMGGLYPNENAGSEAPGPRELFEGRESEGPDAETRTLTLVYADLTTKSIETHLTKWAV